LSAAALDDRSKGGNRLDGRIFESCFELVLQNIDDVNVTITYINVT